MVEPNQPAAAKRKGAHNQRIAAKQKGRSQGSQPADGGQAESGKVLGKCGPKSRAPARFSPATPAPSVAALPMRGPAKPGASDVATGAANPFEIARDSRVHTRNGFFSGSADALPLVVLRNQPMAARLKAAREGGRNSVGMKKRGGFAAGPAPGADKEGAPLNP